MDNNTKRQKVRVSSEEFAHVLGHWLSLKVSKEMTEQVAHDFGFKVKRHEDFFKIRHELLLLNIWFIVDACEQAIEDIEKRDACLNRFLGLIFTGDTGGKFEGVPAWLKTVRLRCRVYANAMGMEYVKRRLLEANSLWEVSKLIGESLFGKTITDIRVLTQIMIYVSAGMTYTLQMVREYDIR
jgi:hypothetical protein